MIIKFDALHPPQWDRRFALGDTVKVVHGMEGTGNVKYVGETGTIVPDEVGRIADPYSVKLDDGPLVLFWGWKLELIEPELVIKVN